MLSQLWLVATDLMDRYTFLRIIIDFFTNFRALLAPSSSEDQELGKSMGRKRGRKKVAANSKPVSSKMLEPDCTSPSVMPSHLCLLQQICWINTLLGARL